MSFTNDEKRWLVVGSMMYKILAPVLREFVKQGMESCFTRLDSTHHLQTLTHEQAASGAVFKNMKFQNINNNSEHSKEKKLYNYKISSAVDLARLHLPEYLINFTDFDESLDLSAVLRLLSVSSPPIFTSKSPAGSIQVAAEDMRKEVKNRWGNCVVKDWSKPFLEQCFVKMEGLVKCLGLPKAKKTELIEKLHDWKNKGHKLCTPGEVTEQRMVQFVEHQLIFFSTEKDNVLEQEFPDAYSKLKSLEEKVKSSKESHAASDERERKKELRRRQSSCFKLNLDDVSI